MRYRFQLLFAWAFVLALVFATPIFAQAGTDLSGEWTGDSSGNHVTIEMRTGGFAVSFSRQQQAGQSGGSLFFRDAGSGTYLHTFGSGPDATVQVLGANAIRVTNPDGWTDVFRRVPAVNAGGSPASAPPASSQSSAQHQEPPGADAAAVADFHKSCAHLGDAAALAHYGNVFLEMRSDKDGPQKWRKTLPETVVSPYQCMLHVLLRHATNGVPGSVGDANSTVHPTPVARSNTEVKQSEADAKYASEVAEYQRQLAAQQKAVADYEAAQRQMAADKAAAAARAKAAQEEFARQQAAYQAELGRYASERADLSIGGQTPPWKQQGKDARIIASDGKSAMDCVKLIELTKTDSSTGGGGRVLSNQCGGPVEITWCYSPGDCDTETGAGWTVQAGKSWPVSADKNIRWAACHGANTASFVKGSHGLSYYCKAPE